MPSKPKAESVQSLSVNKTIALAVLVSITVVVISGFLIKLLISSISFNGRVVSKKATANDQLVANFDAATSLVAAFDQLGSRVTLINDALPTTPDFAALVASTEAIAGSSGVHLKSVTTNDAPLAATPGVKKPLPFQYSVSASGSYDNLLKFFSNLELSSRPIRLLSLTQTGTSAAQSAEAKLETYYQAAADITPKIEVVK